MAKFPKSDFAKNDYFFFLKFKTTNANNTRNHVNKSHKKQLLDENLMVYLHFTA